MLCKARATSEKWVRKNFFFPFRISCEWCWIRRIFLWCFSHSRSSVFLLPFSISLSRARSSLSHLTKIVFRVSNLHCELSTCSLFKQHFTFSAHLPSHIIDVAAAVAAMHAVGKISPKKSKKIRSVYFVSLSEAFTCIYTPTTRCNQLLTKILFLIKLPTTTATAVAHTFYYRSFALWK